MTSLSSSLFWRTTDSQVQNQMKIGRDMGRIRTLIPTKNRKEVLCCIYRVGTSIVMNGKNSAVQRDTAQIWRRITCSVHSKTGSRTTLHIRRVIFLDIITTHYEAYTLPTHLQVAPIVCLLVIAFWEHAHTRDRSACAAEFGNGTDFLDVFPITSTSLPNSRHSRKKENETQEVGIWVNLRIKISVWIYSRW